MICEINAKEKRRALKIFKEQQERVARDARELRDNEFYFKGKDEGEEEGVAFEKEATARRLKAMGSTDEFISEATGLSLEKVKSL